MNAPATDVPATSLVPLDWDVPKSFRQRLGDRIGRQRAMSAEGHLLLVLHSPPQTAEHQRDGRLFWRQPDGQWRASHSNAGNAALSEHFAEYRNLLEEIDDREDVASTADQYFRLLSELTPLYRAARNQHLALQQARAELRDIRDVINFRDEAYELEREADLLLSDAKNALDFSIAKKSEEQARTSHQMAVSSHRLNLLVAFFFPIATLVSVFGTNLQHGLEAVYAPVPFVVVLATGLLFGVLLRKRVSRPPSGKEARM